MNPFLDKKASRWYSFSYQLLRIHQDIIPIYSCWFLHAASSFWQQFLHWGTSFIYLSTNRFASPPLAEGSTCSSKPTNNIHCSKCKVNSTIHSPLCLPEPPLPFTVKLSRCLSSSVSLQVWKKTNHIFFFYSSSKYHCTSLHFFSEGSPQHFSGHAW